MKSRYRTSLTAAKKDQLLTKIKALVDERPSRFILDRGRERFHGAELTGIVISPNDATGTVEFDAGAAYGVSAAAVVLQDLTFTAKVQADAFYPNNATITYLDGAALAVSTNGRDIVVTLNTGVSTANAVKAAIEALPAAAALVVITVSGTGTDVQVAAAKTALAGGASVQSYDKADIVGFRRLRTHRWAIELTSDANPV